MSQNRRWLLLTGCWWRLLIPVLSACQSLYHLVNVGARFWGWQALYHFLLTCGMQNSAVSFYPEVLHTTHGKCTLK
jgi:hypothetical protein